MESTEEPICRAGIETDTENGLMDTEGEGEGEMIGRVGLTYIY